MIQWKWSEPEIEVIQGLTDRINELETEVPSTLSDRVERTARAAAEARRLVTNENIGQWCALAGIACNTPGSFRVFVQGILESKTVEEMLSPRKN